jgi:hypothetical protein
MKIDVVTPTENFRGMSYGDWSVIWSNWLVSEEPDNYAGDDVLFLRGNVDYKPLRGATGAPRHSDPESFYDRTGKNGEKIFEGTAIFFPVVNAQLNIGELYDGRLIKNEEDMRFAARKDIDEGGAMWANILRKGDKKATKIVKNLKDYRIESPLFKLVVAQNSQLRDRMESPLKPGIYDSVTVGYYILIRSLAPSTYRIHFGGKGRGIYYTDSVYDITVQHKNWDSVIDRSGHKIALKREW